MLMNSEIELFVEALRWKKGYFDSNPDVGFGPSLETLLEGIAVQANIRLDATDEESIINLYTIRYVR